MVVQLIVGPKKLEAVYVDGDEPTRLFLQLDKKERLSAQAQGLGGGGRVLGARLGAGSKFRKGFGRRRGTGIVIKDRGREKVGRRHLKNGWERDSERMRLMLWGGQGGVPGVCVFVCRVTNTVPHYNQWYRRELGDYG
jgi:hypothetical protein